MKIKLLFFLVLLMMLTSCPGTNSGNSSEGDIDQYFWGSWVRMDGINEEWYISDSVISIEGTDFIALSSVSEDKLQTSSHDLVRKTENMLTVNPGANEYYLFRKSGATASITSGVVSGDSISSSIRGLDGIGGIRVLMQNVKNTANLIEAETDSSGNLLFEDIIPQDEYSLVIPEQTGVDKPIDIGVKPEFDGENIGFITLSNADQNFKVSYSLSAGDEWGYYYAGDSYTLNLTITNIGTADMLSADYRITEPSGLNIVMVSDRLEDILGTVQANGGTESLTYTISTDGFSDDYKDFDIPIEIVSYDGLYQWNDQIRLRFYRDTMSLHVASSTNEVQGVVISPDNRSFPFRTSSLEGSITLPARESGYVLALSGADYNSETKYALQINSPPNNNGASLTSSRINEPNNDETSGTDAYSGEEYLGYLGVYDLDFYRVHNEFDDGTSDGTGDGIDTGTADEVFSVSGYSVSNDTTPFWYWSEPSEAVNYRYSITDNEGWTETTNDWTSSIEFARDGSYTLYVQYQNAEGEWSQSASYTTIIDTVPPSVPAVSGETPTTETTPTWSWTASEEAYYYRYNFDGSDSFSTTFATSFVPPEALSVGEHTIYVQARDRAGNWSESASFTITIEENPNLVFSENFESYSVDTLPSDYVIAYNGAGTSSQVVKAETGNQYLQTKGQSGWGLSMRKDFSSDFSSQITISLKIQTQTASSPTDYNSYGFCDVGGFYFKNASEVAGAFKIGVKSDGNMYIWRPDAEAIAQSVQINRNEWVNCRVVVDFSAQRFDLYVEESLICSDSQMGVADLSSTWNPYGENACIMYHSGNTTSTTTVFDDISIYYQ